MRDNRLSSTYCFAVTDTPTVEVSAPPEDASSWFDPEGVEWVTLKEAITRTDGSEKTERQVRERAGKPGKKIRALPRKSKFEKLWVAFVDVEAYVEARGPVDDSEAETVTMPLVAYERETELIDQVADANLQRGRAEGVEQGLRDQIREQKSELDQLRTQLADRFVTAVGAAQVATAINVDALPAGAQPNVPPPKQKRRRWFSRGSADTSQP